MRFGSAVRVSGRVAVAFAVAVAVAAAVALEDALRTRGDRDWVNRKDAALGDFALRRILF